MATAIPVCRTARQAKRAGPKLEAGPQASAERSEGTMEARQGRDAAGGSMRSTTARPAISQVAGDARTSRLDAQAHAPGIGKQARLGQRLLWSGRSGAAGSAAFEGRQAARGGDSPQGFPLEASKARSAPLGARRHHAESSGRRLDSETGIHDDDEFTR